MRHTHTKHDPDAPTCHQMCFALLLSFLSLVFIIVLAIRAGGLW
jgi:hypothetical protein